MYIVETTHDAAQQIALLPKEALVGLSELTVPLSFHPWSGESFNRRSADPQLRALEFGDDPQGVVIYLILEDQRRVVVLRVLWPA